MTKDLKNNSFIRDLSLGHSGRKDDHRVFDRDYVEKLYYEAFKYFLEKGAFVLTEYDRKGMQKTKKVGSTLYGVNRYRGILYEDNIQIVHYRGVTLKIEADFGYGIGGGGLDFRIVGDKEIVKSVGEEIKSKYSNNQIEDFGLEKSHG